ncbi:unnamed protein product [Protopolystoma xenopodis]|uniref:Uncharacterized protein n=1 Tax=Protopolystoma xenopodis TaxID=117903 RepID=A0A448WVS5_9PLAT|nr:unnamed protein product [Protopolystoma xenopodis]
MMRFYCLLGFLLIVTLNLTSSTLGKSVPMRSKFTEDVGPLRQDEKFSAVKRNYAKFFGLDGGYQRFRRDRHFPGLENYQRIRRLDDEYPNY